MTAGAEQPPEDREREHAEADQREEGDGPRSVGAPGGGTFEKGGGVPTTTQGAIEDGRGAGEQRFDLGQEHWDVVGANAPGWESTDRAHALIEGLLGRVMLVRC